MIQVVILKARNVCGNLETSVAQLPIQLNVPRRTGPLKDPLDALANECLSVISTQATL
jgi:ACT domain-containing protein